MIVLSISLFKILEADWFRLGLPILLIVLFGIPHGATDHLADNYSKSGRFSSSVSFGFLLHYLSPIAIYGLLWWLLPTFSLIFFLAISAYHFGETQIMASFKCDKKLGSLLYFSWGSLLLAALFLFHPNDTYVYLKEVVSVINTELITSVAEIVFISASVIFVGSSAYLFYSKNLDAKNTGLILLDTFLLITLIWQTDLLYGFAIFFACWHSYDAILLQIEGFKQVKQSFDMKSFYKYASPFTAISLVALAVLFYLFINYQLAINLAMVFFIFISVITLPHMLTIRDFYDKLMAKAQ